MDSSYLQKITFQNLTIMSWPSSHYGFLVTKPHRIKYRPEDLILSSVPSFPVLRWDFQFLHSGRFKRVWVPFSYLFSLQIEGDFDKDECELMLVTELWAVISKWLNWGGLRLESVVFSKGAKTVKSHQQEGKFFAAIFQHEANIKPTKLSKYSWTRNNKNNKRTPHKTRKPPAIHVLNSLK